MAEWIEAPLESFLTRLTYGFTNPMPTTDAGPYMVTAKDINYGRILYEQARHTNIDAYTNLLTDKSRPNVGDVLVTKDGTLGRIAVVDRADICINQSVAVLQPKETICSRFLKYLLEAPFNFRRMIADADGTTIKHIYITRLAKMMVSVPSLSEQNRIVGLLGALDDKIENNRAMNETLEEMARAIFKSWFVDFDPVHAKSRGEQPAHMDAETAALFPDRFGDDGLPEGWRAGRVEDLIDFNPKEKLSKGSIATYVEMAHLPTQGPSINHWEKRELKSGTKFRNGDTLFARITPCLENGKTAFVDILEDDEVAWGSTEYIVMRSKKWVPSAFSYVLARHSPFRETAQKSMTGTSGRQRAQADVISDFKIALAPNDVFNAYGGLIEIWFQKIRMNVKENNTLAELRDTLLPKLMSGEIRIKDAEREVGAAV